jgi:hypothetical protein
LLARSRPLHLTQPALRGPLLIPAVSSKGFPIVNGLSEVGKVLELWSPDMTEALLVSAYDLHHGLLPDHGRLLGPEHAQTLYATPSLLVVDSGGYELLDAIESGETLRGPQEKRPFERADFEALVDRLPRDRDQLVVTYDEPNLERPGYRQQREAAQQFAAARPHLKVDFLLKPPAGDRFVDPAKLTPDAADLRSFAAIGVTEKELGDTVLDRLVCLAQLRKLLDDSGGEVVPIHVFGALDPLLTPLYFMAGGEIFDGLSWLRYAYHDDTALHPDELAVLTGSIEAIQTRRDALRQLSNLQQLRALKLALERWANEPERYELLGRHHDKFREIYETLQARLGRRD